MLTSDDAAVAAREHALPGMALLLDADAFAAALRERLPDAGITGAEEFYARYKPGRSCVAAYRVDLGDGEVDVYARAMRRESFARIEDMRPRAPVTGALGAGGLLLDEPAVAVWVFPNDRRIETLPLLGGAATRAELLAQVMPDRTELWGAGAGRLRYWPERRFVARLDGPDGEVAALKLYAERSYGNAGHNAVAFESRGPLRIPGCLGRSDELRVLAFEWLPGTSLDRLLVEPGFDASLMSATGAALAELHGQEPAGLVRPDPVERTAFLHTRAAWVGTVRADLAHRVRALAERLDGELRTAHGPDRSLHGDFSPAQVLVADGAVAVLDFDDAALGDPAEDLGVFISRVELRVQRGKLDRARGDELIDAFLTGYGATDRDRVRLYLAAELVRRLPGAFRRRRDDWMDVMEATLARAEEVAG